MLPSLVSGQPLLHRGRQLMAVRRRAPAAAMLSHPRTCTVAHALSSGLTFPSQGCGCQPLGSSPWRSVNAASHRDSTIPSRTWRRPLCSTRTHYATAVETWPRLLFTYTFYNIAASPHNAHRRREPGAELCPRTTREIVPAIPPWGAAPGATHHDMPDRKWAIHPPCRE